MGLNIVYQQPQEQVFVFCIIDLHDVLSLSSTVQCVDELFMSVASRLQKYWKWLLSSIMPHTVAIDWAILSFLVSRPVLLRGKQG